jgi:hypothetical protein
MTTNNNQLKKLFIQHALHYFSSTPMKNEYLLLNNDFDIILDKFITDEGIK